jgi:mRNA deadenylase, exonuclease subunit and related nucleases
MTPSGTMSKYNLLRYSLFCFTGIRYNRSFILSTKHQRHFRAISHEINWAQSLETASSTGAKGDKRQVSILSWNILSQHLFDSTPEWYHYVSKDAPVSWPGRLPRILDEILLWKADIICLQEVEFTAFDDLQHVLHCEGYIGVMQSAKKRTGDNPYGVATFCRRDKFAVKGTFHHSRTMLSLLEDHDQNIIAIVNCHLEGNPKKSATRVKQLHNILQESARTIHHDIIICGDFNCILNDSASSAYLMKSCSKYKDIYEWGRLVDRCVSDIPPHPYSFQSAYPMNILHEAPLDYVTFVSSPHRYVSGLDQIWYHDLNNSVSVRALKHPFLSPDQRKHILESGLPSIHHPSDHLPIGCILEWKSDEKRENLCVYPTDRVYNEMDAHDLNKAASNLLESFPFDTPEQKGEFLYIIRDINNNAHRESLSKDEEIRKLRDQRQRKKILFSEIPKEKVKDLEKIIKLLKRANSNHNADR